MSNLIKKFLIKCRLIRRSVSPVSTKFLSCLHHSYLWFVYMHELMTQMNAFTLSPKFIQKVKWVFVKVPYCGSIYLESLFKVSQNRTSKESKSFSLSQKSTCEATGSVWFKSLFLLFLFRFRGLVSKRIIIVFHVFVLNKLWTTPLV
jgi:hypothetical protein